MPFITYAQNFEDLILYRALRHVNNGLYIDLGAADPDSHSVTRAFYERGWRGINVEPYPGFFARLTERRRDDVNINAAVSDRAGEADFYFVGEHTGLSTLEGGMANWHKQHGIQVRAEKVRLTTLRDICEEHVRDSEIHFLKLDVEGHELAVIQGHDFSRWRPWIIVGEAHDEIDTWDAWKAWQEVLERADYRFVYQDGLNRFFVAVERHEELAKGFPRPPNCYDDWQSAERGSRKSTGGNEWRVGSMPRRTEAAGMGALDRRERCPDRAPARTGRIQRTGDLIVLLEPRPMSPDVRVRRCVRVRPGASRRRCAQSLRFSDDCQGYQRNSGLMLLRSRKILVCQRRLRKT